MVMNGYIFLVSYSSINIVYVSIVKIGYCASVRESYEHKHV